MGWIDEGDDGSLETGSGESATIDSREGTDDGIDADEFWTAAFVIVDGGLAAVEGEFAKQLEIACLPCGYSLTDASVLAIEMLCSLCEAQRHHIASALKGVLRYVAEKGLVEGLQGLILICKHIPCRRLAFIDTEIVVGIDEATGESAEEDTYLEVWHLWMAPDDSPLIAVTVEEEQSVLFAEGYT